MANFPSSTPSFAGFTSSHTLAQDNHAAQHNLEQGEIVALANKVGTGASTPTAGTLLRGTNTGVSNWAQADLKHDVTGILPTSNGGTGQANLTNLPLTTPVISDFTNANHNHTNVAGGGQLGFTALLSTIFSGQVQTQVNSGSAGGTMWWVNLGGLKILWALSDFQTTGVGGNAYFFTLPSFFSSLQSGITSANGLTADARQYANIESMTTSSIKVNGVSAGVSTAAFGLLLIGA